MRVCVCVCVCVCVLARARVYACECECLCTCMCGSVLPLVVKVHINITPGSYKPLIDTRDINEHQSKATKHKEPYVSFLVTLSTTDLCKLRR